MSDNLFGKGSLMNIGEDVDGYIEHYSPKFQDGTRVFLNEIRLHYMRIQEELDLLDKLIGDDISEETFVLEMYKIKDFNDILGAF